MTSIRDALGENLRLQSFTMISRVYKLVIILLKTVPGARDRICEQRQLRVKFHDSTALEQADSKFLRGGTAECIIEEFPANRLREKRNSFVPTILLAVPNAESQISDSVAAC